MGLKKPAGPNSFTLTSGRWIEKTRARGIVSKQGRYGRIFAHKDIAFEFASWISVEFKLYLIKEFQRLKDIERKQLGGDIRRNPAKINYRIHPGAVDRPAQEAALHPPANSESCTITYTGYCSHIRATVCRIGGTDPGWLQSCMKDYGCCV